MSSRRTYNELARKIIVYVVLTLLITCFQVSFPNHISFCGQVMDLMLVYVALVAYFFGFFDGAIIGLCVGLIRDYFSGPSFTNSSGSTIATVGIGMLAMFLVASVASSFFTKRMKRSWLFAFVCVAFCSLCYKVSGHIILAVIMSFFSHMNYGLSLYQIVVESILPSLLLNLIATIPIILILRFIGPYRKGENPALTADFMTGGKSSWLRT